MPNKLLQFLNSRPDFRNSPKASGVSATTMGVGGMLKLFEASSMAGLEEIAALSAETGERFRLIGAGSNILVPDSQVLEPVIRLGRNFSNLQVLESINGELSEQFFQISKNTKNILANLELAPEENLNLIVGASYSLMSLSRQLCSLGLGGLEFAAGIPAQLGGALRMNAGAHGAEMADVVDAVWLLDSNGKLERRSAEAMGYSYRNSSLKSSEIVLAAELNLTQGDPEQIRAKRLKCLEHRKLTQPLHLPSAGSIFKNPGKKAKQGSEEASVIFAGNLLEKCELKGVRVGGVEFSKMHVNWIVRVEKQASAKSVHELIDLAVQKVADQQGIILEPEIIIWP